MSLRWDGIDWKKKRITVVSPKTEHHPGRGQRIIPLFADLVTPLKEARAEAPKGAVYAVKRYRALAVTGTGWKNCNLRTAFAKIIRSVGIEPWPKPFHALRASCETELIEQKIPIQTVARRMGHSTKVAVTNYLRVLPEHYDQAVQGEGNALHDALHGSARTETNRELPGSRTPGNIAWNNSVPLCSSASADGEGFEPPVDLRRLQFSRLPQ